MGNTGVIAVSCQQFNGVFLNVFLISSSFFLSFLFFLAARYCREAGHGHRYMDLDRRWLAQFVFILKFLRSHNLSHSSAFFFFLLFYFSSRPNL